MRVSVQAKGLAAEVKRVTDMAKRAADLTPVMKGRAEALLTVIKKDVFAKGQDPFGTPWTPLQEETIERRRNKNKATIKPLIDTARLRDTMHARPTKTGLIFGSADVDAKSNTHLFGSRTVPRRAFLPVDVQGRANFGTGPARSWLNRAAERIKQWVEKGKL